MVGGPDGDVVIGREAGDANAQEWAGEREGSRDLFFEQGFYLEVVGAQIGEGGFDPAPAVDALGLAVCGDGGEHERVPVDHKAQRLGEAGRVELAAEIKPQGFVVTERRLAAHLRGQPDFLLGLGEGELGERELADAVAGCFGRRDGGAVSGQKTGGAHLAETVAEGKDKLREVGVGVRGGEHEGAVFVDVDAALAQQVVEEAREFVAGREGELNQGAELRHFAGRGELGERGAQVVGKPGGAFRELGLEFGAGFQKMGEHGFGGRERQRVAHEGAGEERDAGFGKRRVAILPGAAVERIEVFRVARDNAKREAAAHDLAISGDVGADAEVGLRAAGMKAEAGHHFVEDEGGAGLFGNDAELPQELLRLDVEPAALDRFDEDGGDLVAARPQDVERNRIGPVEDEDLFEGARGDAGGDRRCAVLAVSSGHGAEEDFVEDAVIGAREDGDLVAARDGTGDAGGGEDGFRTGVGEADARHAGQPGHERGDLARERVDGADLEAAIELPVHRVDDEGGAVAEEIAAEGHDEIDVLVAVDVADAGAFRVVGVEGVDHLLAPGFEARRGAGVGKQGAVLRGEPFGTGGAPGVAGDEGVEGGALLRGEVGFLGAVVGAEGAVRSGRGLRQRGRLCGCCLRRCGGTPHELQKVAGQLLLPGEELFESDRSGRCCGRRHGGRRRGWGEGFGRQRGVQIGGDGVEGSQFFHELAEADGHAEFALQKLGCLGEKQGVETGFEEAGVGIRARKVVAGEFFDEGADGGEQAFFAGGCRTRDGLGNGRGLDSGGGGPGCGRRSGFGPAAFAFERIRRGGGAVALFGRVEGGPVDRVACHPELAKGFEQAGDFGRTGGGERTEHGVLRSFRRVAARKPGQRVARADFEQGHAGEGRVFEEVGEAVSEAHGFAHVGGPVPGRTGFVGGDPAGRGVGNPGDGRFAEAHLAQDFGEGLDDGLHHGRVEGVRGGEGTQADVLAFQLPREFGDGFGGAGDDTEFRAVEGGDGERRGQAREQFGFGQADSEHGAAGQGLHERGAAGDQQQGVVGREDAGETGRHVLAHAVAEQGRGDDAPGHPEPGERVLDEEERGLGEAGLREFRGGCGFGAGGGEEQIAEVPFEHGGEPLGTTIDDVSEEGLGAVEIRAHTGVLRALAGEEEHNRAGVGRSVPGEDALGRKGGKRAGGGGGVGRDYGAAMAEPAAPGLERVGEVRELAVVRKPGQVVAEVRAGAVERFGGFGGEQE